MPWISGSHICLLLFDFNFVRWSFIFSINIFQSLIKMLWERWKRKQFHLPTDYGKEKLRDYGKSYQLTYYNNWYLILKKKYHRLCFCSYFQMLLNFTTFYITYIKCFYFVILFLIWYIRFLTFYFKIFAFLFCTFGIFHFLSLWLRTSSHAR